MCNWHRVEDELPHVENELWANYSDVILICNTDSFGEKNYYKGRYAVEFDENGNEQFACFVDEDERLIHGVTHWAIVELPKD